MTQAQCRPLWVLGFALAVMVIWSCLENSIKGRIPKNQLASRFNAFDFGKDMEPAEVQKMMESSDLEEWDGKRNIQYETLGLKKSAPWFTRPGLYEILTIVAMIALMIWLW